MAKVTITLPSLLHSAIGCSEIAVEGNTIQQCLDQMVATHPKIKVHLFDEAMAIRRHVNILYRGKNLKWLDSWEVEVADGDQLDILQAVSGG